MKKIITFTFMAIATLYWLVKHPATVPEKELPANAPFIMNSHRPGMCKVSTITTSAGINKNLPNVVCKVQTFSVN
ncbi:hypothetical protein [Kluyvera sp. CRP]|uniref:hypothetical protein n=1 Tax=Kluyvera sp. CRP TaxID=2873269 RepID=UPI001CC1F015|nr:hypothetical protein [Kluyvera sp. CRP]UAK20369.1 hypothetical protein K7B04_00135 [Kluyvera sp. CRP]